jgi:hypothetical protein
MVVTVFHLEQPERVGAIKVIGFFLLLRLCNLKLKNAGLRL